MNIFDSESVDYAEDFDVEGVSLRELADEFASTDGEDRAFELEELSLASKLDVAYQSADTLEEVVNKVKTSDGEIDELAYESLAMTVNTLSAISNYTKSIDAEDVNYDTDRDALVSELETTAEGFLADLGHAITRITRRVIRTISAGFKTLITRQGKIAKMAAKLESKMAGVGEGKVNGMTVKSAATSDWFWDNKDAMKKLTTYASARKEFSSIQATVSELAGNTAIYTDIIELNKSMDKVAKSIGKISNAELLVKKHGEIETTAVCIPGKASGPLLSFAKNWVALSSGLSVASAATTATGAAYATFQASKLAAKSGGLGSSIGAAVKKVLGGRFGKAAASKLTGANTFGRGAFAAVRTKVGSMPGVLGNAAKGITSMSGATSLVVAVGVVALAYGVYRGAKWVMARRVPTLSISEIGQVVANLQEGANRISLRGLAGSLQSIEKSAAKGKNVTAFDNKGQARAYVKGILSMTSAVWSFMTGVFRYSVSCSKAGYVYAVKSLKQHAKTGGREDVDHSDLIADLDYVSEKLDPNPEGYDAEGNLIATA